jgi:hypothetical protein
MSVSLLRLKKSVGSGMSEDGTHCPFNEQTRDSGAVLILAGYLPPPSRISAEVLQPWRRATVKF